MIYDLHQLPVEHFMSLMMHFSTSVVLRLYLINSVTATRNVRLLCRLHTSNSHCYKQPRTRYKIAERSFSFFDPEAWDNQPPFLQCESKKSPLRGPDISHFSHKRLRIFNRFFTHLSHVPIYARLQIFIQSSPTLTKLCHIKRDCPVHIICAKCPKRAKTRAFRRLRKSLIDLLIVVCGK